MVPPYACHAGNLVWNIMNKSQIAALQICSAHPPSDPNQHSTKNRVPPTPHPLHRKYTKCPPPQHLPTCTNSFNSVKCPPPPPNKRITFNRRPVLNLPSAHPYPHLRNRIQHSTNGRVPPPPQPPPPPPPPPPPTILSAPPTSFNFLAVPIISNLSPTPPPLKKKIHVQQTAKCPPHVSSEYILKNIIIKPPTHPPTPSSFPTAPTVSNRWWVPPSKINK